MKANKRMNLFAGLLKQKTPQRSVKIEMGVHGYFSIAIAVLFVAIAIPSWRSHQTVLEELKSSQDKFNSEIESLIKSSEERAARRTAHKVAAKQMLEKQTKERELAGVSSRLDGTWTAILWKLVTFAEGIAVDRIDLGKKEPNAPQSGVAYNEKSVVLEGNAKSLETLTEWMEVLTHNLPNSNFVIDRHGVGDDKAYPVKFRLVARMQ
jgi:hypothetical protein